MTYRAKGLTFGVNKMEARLTERRREEHRRLHYNLLNKHIQPLVARILHRQLQSDNKINERDTTKKSHTSSLANARAVIDNLHTN